MEDELEFGAVKDSTAENPQPIVKEEEEAVEEKTTEPNVEEEEEVVEEKPVKDSKTQALDAERARRKQAEKRLKELESKIEAEKTKAEDESRLTKEKENLKKELLEGDYFDEEVAEKFVNTFGDRLLKNQIANERKNSEDSFDKEFSEFIKDELYIDAESYKPEIKELMKKGLTMEQAYRAAIPAGRFEQMRKDLEIEVEQKLLNSNKKAEEVDVGHPETKGEQKRTQYTKHEQDIAQVTGLDVKDVHKRSKIFTLDEMLNL